jgi:hypothetical protein
MGSDRYYATTHFGEKGCAGVKVDSPVQLHSFNTWRRLKRQ